MRSFQEQDAEWPHAYCPIQSRNGECGDKITLCNLRVITTPGTK